MSSTVVELQDVCFAYERDEVLHNLNLRVETGSLVAVVGPNGGGKSTMLRLMLGLIAPLRGRVSIFGGAPEQARRRIGYVPQHLHFDHAFPVLARDVVLMGRLDRHLFGPYRRHDRAVAERCLERVGAGSLVARRLADLSGGERQRVLVAQALAAEPELLLLDEPTASVDAEAEHSIHDLLGSLTGEVTMLVVSHNLNVVTRHATHVACVNRSASLCSLDDLSDAELQAAWRGDLAVLRHGTSCHVNDPRSVMSVPHRGEEFEA